MRNILMFFLFFLIHETYALSWQDLWFSSDQQASKLMQNQQYTEAAKKFKRPDWQASAYYRAGDYQKAAALFNALKTSSGFYNEGNAFARLGQFEKAIHVYDLALKIDPVNEDARFNRDLVKKLLKQKQEQKQKQKSQQDAESKPNPDKKTDDKTGTGSKQTQENQEQSSPSPNAQENPKQKQPGDQNNPQQSESVQGSQSKSNDEQEKQQAKEQWLRLIPDPAGSLLKEKFLRDHLRRIQGRDP